MLIRLNNTALEILRWTRSDRHSTTASQMALRTDTPRKIDLFSAQLTLSSKIEVVHKAQTELVKY